VKFSIWYCLSLLECIPKESKTSKDITMINEKRLGDCFTRLAQVDSESFDEARIAGVLEDILRQMGADVAFDDAAAKVGSNSGNLIATFKGNADVEPIFLSGHMDTVKPGKGVRVLFKDGVFTSDGTTILGSDDKSALAIIIEVMTVVREQQLLCPPVEIIISVCEEMGLLGAKHLDFSMVKSRFGYILDSTDTQGIVTRAPSANKITAKVFGRAAHAGAAPENGICALSAASRAIAGLALGRIDEETTCNLGLIAGGAATNIVPEYVEVNGEARSHDLDKLARVTQRIKDAFETACDRQPGEDLPRAEVEVVQDFPNTSIPEDHRVITLAREAAANLGRALESKTIGGGADANIFFGKGLMAGVIGTGMTDVHTLKESIKLQDMVSCAELVLEILQVHAKGDA